jgi:hypothetical protein
MPCERHAAALTHACVLNSLVLNMKAFTRAKAAHRNRRGRAGRQSGADGDTQIQAVTAANHTHNAVQQNKLPKQAPRLQIRAKWRCCLMGTWVADEDDHWQLHHNIHPPHPPPRCQAGNTSLGGSTCTPPHQGTFRPCAAPHTGSSW